MKLQDWRAPQSVSQHQFRYCEQCDSLLSEPEWSEQVSQRCIKHLWSCDACGYQFEQSVYFAKN